jgi:spore maturation protein CgeB
VPGVHYLALKSDFSNVADVMAEFRDPERRQAITTAAYDLAMAAHTHRHRIAMIRDRVSAAA